MHCIQYNETDCNIRHLLYSPLLLCSSLLCWHCACAVRDRASVGGLRCYYYGFVYLSMPNLLHWSLTDYQSEYKEILQTLSTGLEPRVIDGHQWYKNNQYLFYEDRIVVPEARLDGCLQWSHLSSGHTGANRSVDFFRECFYSSLTLTELRSSV